MTTAPFDPRSPGNLTDRTIVITGANTGIGFEAARLFGRAGARLVLCCRDPGKAEGAAEKIRSESKPARVEVVALDLADLGSVRSAAASILDRVPAIDVLVNNAGVMALPRRTTKDGFEMQFGTNHLGHFAFTGHLVPAIIAAPAARVVNVSSGLHRRGRMNFDDLQGERHYDKWKAYAQSKLSNLLFAYELERRFRAAGTRAISLGCHPGYASTELQHRGPVMEGSKLLEAIMSFGNSLLAQSAEAGAYPTVFAAVCPEARGMDYVGPMGLAHMRGLPGRDRSTRRSHDETDARRLWEISEKLTGVTFDALRARAAS